MFLRVCAFYLVHGVARGQDAQPEIERTCEDDCQCVRKNIGNCCGTYLSCVRLDFEPDLEGMAAWCESADMMSVCGFSEGPCKCEAGECVDGSPTITCPAEEANQEPAQSLCGSATDACMNDDNYAECRALEDDGCASILVMESCPVQFACGDEPGSAGNQPPDEDEPDPAQSVCGSATDACMNDGNYAECRAMEEDGCVSIMTMESCPLQFSCGDDANGGGPANSTTNSSSAQNQWASSSSSAWRQWDSYARTVAAVAILCAWHEL